MDDINLHLIDHIVFQENNFRIIEQHFASCEAYRQRIIQLGEAPDRVFNVGGLVVKDDVGGCAEKAGLFVLTQTRDGGAMLNRKDFRPKEFSWMILKCYKTSNLRKEIRLERTCTKTCP